MHLPWVVHKFGFKLGETLTIDEALKCICVVSANDVCVAMSELIGGTESNFVSMMNERAKGLGMENTNFVNCHGIDAEGHYTCAKDIALMSRELMQKHPEITKYTTIWMDSIRGGTFELSNTNKLIKTYDGITGLKTGFTSSALYNLSATATRDDLSLIAVVLGGKTSEIRNNEITQLLNYGFSNYSTTTLAKKGEKVQNIKINKNIFETVDLVFADDLKLLCEKGNAKEFTTNVTLHENITAPLNAGEVVGKVDFLDKDNNILKSTDICVSKDVPKSSLLEYMQYTFLRYLSANL